MTPKQFAALLDRREIELDRQKHAAELANSMIAQLTAMVVNFGFRSPESPVTYKDFMPKTTEDKVTPKVSKAAMRERVAGEVRALFKAHQDHAHGRV